MVAAEAPKQANSASNITAVKGERFSMGNPEIPSNKIDLLTRAACCSGSRSFLLRLNSGFILRRFRPEFNSNLPQHNNNPLPDKNGCPDPELSCVPVILSFRKI
jgi:hypothetical protein